MAENESGVPFRFENRVYVIRPDFRFVREIEEELGSLPALQEKFSRKDWRVSDLVTLAHMMLQAAGRTVDYVFLGDLMLKEGLDRYLPSVRSFLQRALRAR